MKKIVLIAAAMLALVSMSVNVEAAEESTKLTGEPVDISCYLGGQSGAGHASCAATCAAKGLPIGFVTTEDGKSKLYLVLGDGGKTANDLLGSHMGKQVQVTGQVVEQGGMMVIKVSEVTVKDQADAGGISKPTLVFYSLPLTVCPVCKTIDTWVADLTKTFDGKVAFEQKDSTDSVNQAEMAARNIDGHGIVILDGKGEVAWVSTGHNLTKELVAEGLELVASKQ